MGDLFRSDLPRLVREADILIEVRDARIPLASALPLDDLVGPGKRRFIVLSRADLADEGLTRLWTGYMRRKGLEAFAVNCRTGDGLGALKKALVDARRPPGGRREAGTGLKTLRAVVVGIPNVGKSSLVNRLAGARKARVGARPGITRGRQWIMVGGRTALLDTPGVIQPGAVDGRPGATGGLMQVYLSAVGAIPDDAVDTVMVAGELIRLLGDVAPQGLAARYGPDLHGLPAASALAEIGRRRGCLGPGGQVDLNRAAQVVLADFREGKLGRVTLESPVDLWPAVREGPAHDKPVRDEPDRGGDTPTGP